MPPRTSHEIFRPPHTASPFTWLYRTLQTHGRAGGNEPHYHPDTIEVCFVARGRLDWWSGDEAFEIHAGDALVVPPGLPHGSVDPALQPCDLYTVHLAPEALSPAIVPVAAGLGGRYADSPEAGETVRRLFDAHRRRDPLLAELGAAYATLLLAALARASGEADARQGSRLVRQAQASLADVEGATPTVEEVARGLGVSSVWLSRRFRQELGQSPGEWQRSRRLVEAKRLLAMGRASVTEVAVRLGYSSGQYFATAFRHEYGMTPSAYRELCASAWPDRASAAIGAPMR